MNMSDIKIKRILLLVGFFVLLFSTSQLSWGSGYVIDWDNLNNGIQTCRSTMPEGLVDKTGVHQLAGAVLF